MSKDTPTPAHLLALALSSRTGGKHGDFYQTGNLVDETSVGPRLLVWSSLSNLSWPSTNSQAYKSLETTQGLSKAGGPATVVMPKQIVSSNKFTRCWKITTRSLQLGMSTPSETQQTDLPAAFTHHHTFSFPQLTSPTTSDLSSLTSMPLPNLAKDVLLNTLLRRPKPTSPSPNKFDVTKPTPPHTSNHTTPSKRLCLIDAIQNPHPAPLPEESDDHPMDANLPQLSPSPLRPHCAATDRIRHWKPENVRNTLDADGLPTNLNEHDLTRIQQVLKEAYAPSTRSTYGTGLFTFHLFCNLKSIEERHQAPIDPIILTSFVASLTGIYGGDSIRNFVYGICAWHIIHGVPWKVDNNTLQALFTASRRLAPPDAKKEETKPWTTSYLIEICKRLDINDPEGAAMLACLTTAFWATARLGEVTVPKLKGFNPRKHIKVSNMQHDVSDRNNLRETVIFIPWTKSAREQGEKIFWAKQEGILDPKVLANHLRINNPSDNQHLFAYKHKKGMQPMVKSILLTKVHKTTELNNLPQLSGHGIRVGSTLEYLLRGLPFDVVKAKGRWQSDAFKCYLRKHAKIMVPYMQSNPTTLKTFICYAMPPAR